MRLNKNKNMVQAMQLPVEKLRPFEGHPFQVKDDAEMEQLVWSILTQGLLTPITARPVENATLATEIKQLQSSEAELVQQQNAGNEKKKTTLQIIPTTQHILDNYDILTILEKNQLWKLVLKKVTVYRSQDDELSIQLYPNLPK